MHACPVCATENRDEALICTLCSHMLGRAPDEAGERRATLLDFNAPLPEKDKPVENELEGAARWFAMIMPLALALWAAAVWMLTRETYPDALAPLFTSPGFHRMLLLAALGLAAYGVGITARAMGADFWPSFLIALVPPAIPGVLAHAARRPVWRLYAFLLGEFIIFNFLSIYIAEHPDEALSKLALDGMIVMIPFLCFHLLGGALREICDTLDLVPWKVISWVCLGPLGVYLAYLAEMQFVKDLKTIYTTPEGYQNPLDKLFGGHTDYAITNRVVSQFIDQTYGIPVIAIIVFWIFATITAVVWIKRVYDRLLLPTE